MVLFSAILAGPSDQATHPTPFGQPIEKANISPSDSTGASYHPFTVTDPTSQQRNPGPVRLTSQPNSSKDVGANSPANTTSPDTTSLVEPTANPPRRRPGRKELEKVCGVCGKKYARNYLLKNHMSSHGEEKGMSRLVVVTLSDCLSL